MIVLVGASASGKTELAKKLYQTYGYTKCITTTTRPKRQGERDDVDYHFLDEETFLILEQEDAFYEVTHYNGYLYGIQKKDVMFNGVVIVDPNGANTLISRANKHVFIVYVETSEDIRKKRMLSRGDTIDHVNQRLLHDRSVFHRDVFLRIDLLIENESHTLSELARTVHQAYQSFCVQT